MPATFRTCHHCQKRTYPNWRSAMIDARRLNRQQNRGLHIEPYVSRACGGAVHLGGSLTHRHHHSARYRRWKRRLMKRNIRRTYAQEVTEATRLNERVVT